MSSRWRLLVGIVAMGLAMTLAVACWCLWRRVPGWEHAQYQRMMIVAIVVMVLSILLALPEDPKSAAERAEREEAAERRRAMRVIR
jgi:uncharacterized membrane protein